MERIREADYLSHNQPYPEFADTVPPSKPAQNIMALLVTFGSKAVKTKDGESLYLVTVEGNKTLWSNEPLRGGLIVSATPRVAGTKYTASDGTEKTVLKDGLNFDFLLGTAADAQQIALAKTAKMEIDL